MTSWRASTEGAERSSGPSTTIRCYCGKEAFFREPHTREPLCKEHFFESVWRRAEEELKGVKGKILLAVSGGKDSLVLMDVMARVYDPSKLVAVTVVEGAEGYERVAERAEAARLAKELGIEYYYVTFKDIYGKSLAEMVKIGKQRPCTYCGVFRRRALELVAIKLGASIIATGHTLDDEIHTAFLNLLRGDWEGIAKLGKGRLKPLRRVFEKEVAAYAYARGFHFQKEECPYLELNPSLRSKTRERLFELVELEPHKLFEWSWRVKELPFEIKGSICERCGFPTSPGRRLCRVCELAEEVGVRVPRKEEASKITLRTLKL